MPGNKCEWVQSARGMQGNALEWSKMPGEQRGLQGMPGERMEVGAKCQWNAGECRGIPGYCKGVPGECKGVSAMYLGNAGDYQCNVLEGVQSAWGMPRECMGVGTKCRECRGMQGDARGTYGPGKCMGVGTKCQGNGGQERSVMQGNAKEHIEVGAKCQWNARECKGMQGECIGVGAKCQ